MDDGTNRAELGEVQGAADEPPYLRMWLAEVDDVDALSFPTRSVRKLLEAALPGFVEFDQHLGADVSRDLREPRQLGPKRGQLADLIERGRVAALTTAPGQSTKPLLVRELPEEPQGITPAICRRNLFPRRIDAVAEGFADEHSILGNTAIRQPTRSGFHPAMNGGGSAWEIR